jgi:hypothetical protein
VDAFEVARALREIELLPEVEGGPSAIALGPDEFRAAVRP